MKRCVSIIEHSQPKGVKTKSRERKSRSGVNWQRTLKQKGVKQTGVKKGLGTCLYMIIITHLRFKSCNIVSEVRGSQGGKIQGVPGEMCQTSGGCSLI